MNDSNAQPQAAADVDEEAVVAFLMEHRDFLERHPQVLEAMKLYHDAGGAVSLIEHQVESLRRDKRQAQNKLQELIATARENELRVAHLNALARVLIEAESAADLVAGLDDFLGRELAVDALFIGILGDSQTTADGLPFIDPDGPEAEALTNVFRRGKPLCGPLSERDARVLFGTADPAPQSAAMVPLGSDAVRGAMVLGSCEPQHFVAEMGTMFLELMGELVTTACRRSLGAGAL